MSPNYPELREPGSNVDNLVSAIKQVLGVSHSTNPALDAEIRDIATKTIDRNGVYTPVKQGNSGQVKWVKTPTVVNERSANKLDDEQPNSLAQKLVKGVSSRIGKFLAPAKRKTKNPLLSRNNFMAAVQANPHAVDELREEPATEEEVRVLEEIGKVHTQVRNFLDAYLPTSIDERDGSTVAELLRDENGEILDNAAGAISVSIANWVATRSNSTLFNDDRSINQLLGRDNNATVPAPVRNLLAYRGVGANVMAENLGRDIAQLMGLAVSRNAPGGSKAKLEQDLGNLALMMMRSEHMGLITYDLISRKAIEAVLDGETLEGSENNMVMYRVRTTMAPLEGTNDMIETTVPEVDRIVEAFKGQAQLMTDLFGIENRVTEPSFEPVKRVVDTMRGTNQKLSKEFKEGLKKAQQQTWSLKTDTDSAFNGLSRATRLKLFGYEEGIEARTHIDQRKGAVGANNAAVRSLEHYENLRERVGLEKALGGTGNFFFQYFVARQMRTHMDSNTVNPQGDKNHRFLVRQNAWIQDVDLNDQGQVNNFLLTVAEGLDLDRDKHTNQVTLDSVHKKLTTAEIQAAVQVLIDQRNGEEMTPEMEAVLVAGVEATGSGMHGFDALVQYSRMVEAKALNKPSFTTDIMPEVDGVTNGPIIGLIQFAGKEAAELLKKALAKGGIFFDGTSNLAEWKQGTGNADAYEETSQGWALKLDDLIANSTGKQKELLKIVAKHFGKDIYIKGEGAEAKFVIERGAGKQPTMITVYGSGQDALKADLVEAFLESIRTKLAEAATYENPDLSPVELERERIRRGNELISDFNQVAQSTRPLAQVRRSADLLETKVNATQGIRQIVGGSMGSLLFQAVDENYQQFKKNRKDFNNTIQAINTIYVTMLNARLEEKRKELVAAKELEPNELVPQAIRDEIEAELVEVMPIIHTIHSARSGSVNEGLYLGRTKKKRLHDAVHKVTTKLSEGVRYFKANEGGGSTLSNKPLKSASSYPSITEVDPQVGVGPAIMTIHSMDATVAMEALRNLGVLSVFDGFGSGVHDAIATAKHLNQSLFDTMVEYSITAEADKALDRAMAYLAKNDPNRVLTRQVESALKSKETRVLEPGETLRDAKARSAAASRVVTGIKDQITSAPGVWNQYFLENGEIEVNGGIEAIIENANALEEDLATFETEEALPEIEVAEPASQTERSSYFGQLGKEGRQLPADRKLGALFNQGKPVKGSDLIGVILENKNTQTVRGKVVHSLFTRIQKLPAINNIEVRLVTPETDPNDMEFFGNEENRNLVKDSMGVYSTVNGQPVIFLRNADFVHTGLNLETVAHELLHAATVNVLNSSAKDSATRQAKADLTRVVNAIVAAVQNDPNLLTTYPELSNILVRNGKGNIDNSVANAELITWGLTNQRVQEALKTIQVSGTHKSRFKNAFDGMVKAITGLFFPNSRVEISNALAQVIENTGQILAAAEANQSPEQGSLPLAQKQPPKDSVKAKVVRMRPLEIFDALTDQVSPNQKRLREVVEKLTDSLDTDELIVRNMKRGIYDNTDAFLDAEVNQRIPFVSHATKAGFNFNPQEAYVFEQIEAAMAHGLMEHNGARKEAQALYSRLAETLTWEDFVRPGETREQAEARYAYLFEPELAERVIQSKASATGTRTLKRANHLARLIALSVVDEQFRQTLDAQSSDLNPEGDSLSARLQRLVNAVMELFQSWTGKPERSPRMNQRLDQLMYDLADIQTRQHSKLVQSTLDGAERYGQKTNAFLRDSMQSLDKFARSEAMLKGKGKVRKFAGSAISMVAGDRVDQYVNVLEQSLEPFRKGKEGLFGSLITEMRGQNGNNRNFHNLLRYAKTLIDQARRHAERATKEYLKESFTRELTKVERESLTRVLVETDLEVLLNTYSVQQISAMIRNDATLEKAINKARQDLSMYPEANHYRNQAKLLGYFMATGENRSEGNLRLNALNIAEYDATGNGVSTAQLNAVHPVIDRLASLYALKYTDNAFKTEILDILQEENSRQGGANGIETTLLMHRKLKEQALDRNFGGNPGLMIKGYTKEILNNHIATKVIHGRPTEAEHKSLLRRGYTLDHEIAMDPNDPQATAAYMYVSTSDGLSPYMASLVSLTSERRKGSDVEYRTNREVSGIYRNKQQADMSLAQQADVDPTKIKGNYLVPTYDDQGRVMAYRYMMSKANRKRLLERRTDLLDVLGGMSGAVIDKAESKQMNRRTVDALHAQYQADTAEGRNDFVMVGPDSDDASLKELYQMMPSDMKQAIKSKWNSPNMMVRRGLVDLVFGYRKFSLAERLGQYWDVSPNQRKWHQTALVQAAELILRDQSVARLKTAENVWQEVIREVKDIWVIRNLFTLAGNIISNMGVMWASGVPLTKMIQYQKEGYNGIINYQRDHNALMKAQAALSVEQDRAVQRPQEIQRLRREIVVLEDQLTTNPVKELVDAGTFQTIIEDIDSDDDEFSYKQRLTDKIDSMTEGVPESVKTVAGNLFVTRKSHLYRALSHTTQVSDFVARYAVYKQLTTRARNPLAQDEAVEKVVKRFINYDVPTHRMVQWGNDMGFIFFSKYFLRIQTVIWEMMKENPARMLTLAATQGIVDFTDITESILTPAGVINHMNFPVNAVISAPDDVITMHLLGEAF